MIALDTNILVYARREESAHHTAAKALVLKLAEGQEPWALPWPCVYEFLRVVTHAKVFHPPTKMLDAVEGIRSLLASPSLCILTETAQHIHILTELLQGTAVSGNLVHDAHIAALLLEHGIGEIFTTDEDFRRFRRLTVTNPFQ